MDAQSTEARTQSWIDAIASDCKRVRAASMGVGEIGFFTLFFFTTYLACLPRRFVASGDAIACGIASASCMRWLRMQCSMTLVTYALAAPRKNKIGVTVRVPS